MNRLARLSLACTVFITQSLTAATAPADQLQGIIEAHWQWYLQEHPLARTRLGDRSANDRWPDMSLAALENRYRQRGKFLQSLGEIDTSALSGEQQLNHALLSRRLDERRERHELGLDLMTINMRSGPQHYHTTVEYTPMTTEQDYRMRLARLRGLPKLLSQYRELLEEGISRQRVQARVIMQRVPAQIDRLVTPAVEESPYFKPFLELPASFDPQVSAQLKREARQIIAESVNPAYRDFQSFLLDTYLPASRKAPGIGSLPDGKSLYRFLAAAFTTTDLTPEQIHALGKQEVERILQDMVSVKDQVGFTGDLQAFNNFLRTDPQFYYETPEALYEGYLAISKRLDPELVKLFGVLPRMPYGVRPIPAETAPDTTTAYYMRPAADGSRAGYYYVNLYRPEVRPRYEMEVLSVHEAVPGHHLQIALAQELKGLPEFRKQGGATAFIEGWGLYSERLGYQMGLYRDPYSRYGQLTYDMWRAVRLVVDTGIHYFGWDRQQAIDYFMANAGKSEADIVNEIDRYIGWPGQALAYKIGQLKILELRANAEQALGEQFDIRDFHDELLGAGALPLDALERRMNVWLAERKN